MQNTTLKRETKKTIPVAAPFIGKEEEEALLKAIRSGWIAKGPEIQHFEQLFAEYIGVKYARSVSSGTAALEVALRAFDLENSEIITGVSSCVSTLNAILHTAFKPVFVEVDPETYNIDPGQIERHINNNTAAIMPVHLYGHPCDMEQIIETAKAHRIPVIEDCAQALGATYNKKSVGSIGNVGCFSLYANKIITTAEGGMITTNSSKIASLIESIRDHGQHPTKHFYHTLYGYNFKMSNLHAAIGVAQMGKVETIIRRRQENARRLTELLRNVEGVELPKEMANSRHVYFSYPIMLKDENTRNRLCRYLSEHGIETRPMFSPMSTQPFFEDLFGKYPEQFSIAEKIGKQGFYVSCSPTLDRKDIETISSTIISGIKRG